MVCLISTAHRLQQRKQLLAVVDLMALVLVLDVATHGALASHCDLASLVLFPYNTTLVYAGTNVAVSELSALAFTPDHAMLYSASDEGQVFAIRFAMTGSAAAGERAKASVVLCLCIVCCVLCVVCVLRVCYRL